ncbi:MAG TPA: hypothetical protein VM734_09465 [Kofleriaceae bacterium]|nr:hypothetical protein [Kofleriaceae bacterium]
MVRGFLDDAARKAFADTVTAIEAVSAVEVVVSVRIRTRRWLHAHLLVGLVATWAALAFMLYAAHPFALASFLIDPLLAGAVAGAASTLVPAVVRALTPRAIRRRAVVEAARATFLERGVHHTAGRTGVLLYVALTERMAVLIADDGVERAVDPARWQEAAAAIDRAVAAGGHATATALARLTSICAHALPRSHDDVNELPDAIDDGGRPPAREASP